MSQIKGNGFIIAEENGCYTMSWMTGGFKKEKLLIQLVKN
ncbi:hypothetical protein D8823_08535 [Streptococcus gordonii]|nr:hypothetical protein D8823_08535 [Streptococcus gordonii]